MSKSACWSYVTWCKDASGNWATWEPGEIVNVGDVGRFDEDRRFRHYQTLADYGVPFATSEETPVGSRRYLNNNDFRVEARAAENLAPGFSVLGDLSSGARFTARREHACVLQMEDVTESSLLGAREVLVQIAELVRIGEWELDSALVVRRLRAGRGFAAISQGTGQSIEFKSAGSLRLPLAVEIGHAEMLLAHDRSDTGFLLYEFSGRETPVFMPPVRVKRRLWARLLPWRAVGPWLIDPDGRRHDPANLVTDLPTLAPEARRYDPLRSRMTLEELSGIAVEDLFEEVSSLPGEGEPWLASYSALPIPSAPMPLAAADPFDDASPLLETLSPDGLVRFILHGHGAGEYRLEALLTTGASPPVVVGLRYTTKGGAQRELLIPVDADPDGQSGSAVNLAGYALGGSWAARRAVPPGAESAWDDDVLTASIRAAATVATVEAWERVASALPPHAGELITREIGVLRNRQ
jgi:hypothetical protein